MFGHATLATAYCLVSILNYQDNRIVFQTKSCELTVEVKAGFYYMDFPPRMSEASAFRDIITQSLNIQFKLLISEFENPLLST